MFEDFASALIKELVKNEFDIISKNDIANLQNSGLIILGKILPPVFYVACIANGDKTTLEDYDKITKMLSLSLKATAQRFMCKSVICTNIVYTKELTLDKKVFIDKQEYEASSGYYNIFWCVDNSKKDIYCSKNQPSEILNIKDCVKKALHSEKTDDEKDIYAIERETKKKYSLSAMHNVPALTFMIIATNIIIFLIFYVRKDFDTYLYMFANNHDLVLQGEYYRLLTSMFFHAGVSHLLLNCISMYIYGSRYECFVGRGKLFVLYFFSGIFAGIVSMMFSDSFSVGASGAIFGVLGALLVFTLKVRKRVDGIDYITMLTIAAVCLFAGYSNPNIDNFAHLGGFVAGCLFQIILGLIDKKNSLRNS